MKTLIIKELRHINEEADLQNLRSQITSWLDTNFPNWQAGRGRDNDKPYVKIWLEGKP